MILIKNKCVRELVLWTQFLNFNQFLRIEWREIHRTIKLLSWIFKMRKNDLTNSHFFVKYFHSLVLEKRKICYMTYQGEKVLENSA